MKANKLYVFKGFSPWLWFCWKLLEKKSTGNDKVILTWNVLKIRGKNEVYIKYLVQFIG